MSGTPLSEFTTLAASQGPAWATGAEDIVNDAHRNTYVWSRWISGKDLQLELIDAGADIRDTILLDYSSNFQWVNPNVTLTAPNPQTGDTWTVPWAIATDTMSWTEPELDLNGSSMSGFGRTQMYKKVLYQKHQNLRTGYTSALDDVAIGLVPNQDLNESTSPSGPRVPYGLHAAINEYNVEATPYADGTSPAAPLIGGLNGAGLIPSGVDGSSTAWTTFQQINPTTTGKTNWRPYQGTYGTYQNGSPSIDKNVAMQQLFVSMSEACAETEIDQIPATPEYSDPKTMPNVIYTSLIGRSYYEQALRGNQDQFRGVGKTSGEDPAYNGPTYSNIPMVYIKAMNTIPLYATSTSSGGGSGVTELSSSAVHQGPRYIGMNGKYFKPVIHRDKYCVMTEPEQPTGQPLTRVQYMKLYTNTICRSRRRHWHLRPNSTPAA